jgi:hypothetical protein
LQRATAWFCVTLTTVANPVVFATKVAACIGVLLISDMARKYHTKNLLPVLRLFIEARNKALEGGFTDNGGAIHSVERILDILSMHVRYPHLTHINGLKTNPAAEMSVEAHRARERGEQLFIEHVLPQRAYAQKVIELVNDGATDDELLHFIQANYRLVLLTRDETAKINRLNRSRITVDRIAEAGIELRCSDSAPKS